MICLSNALKHCFKIENLIVVSGHDSILQYIERDNIKQIISGAGSKSEAARAILEGDFFVW
jgi:hypothetical protein